MAFAAALPFRHRRKSFSLGRLELSLKPRRSSGRIAGDIVLGAAGLAAGGLALYFLKERVQEEAEHQVLDREGRFSLRRYVRLVTAEVQRYGAMADAMDQGFTPLFEYISAKAGSRQAGASDRRIAMTVPVTVSPAQGDDEGGAQAGSWIVRFVMPRAWSLDSLPEPANGVVLSTREPRTVAAVRFSGHGTDHDLIARKHSELLDWVRKRGLTATSEPEFAAYNAPIVPGLLRRNEWLVEVGS